MKYEVHIVEPTDIDSIGFQSRRKGLEVRDCFLILEPDNKCRLGLLVRPEMNTTVVESVVRGGGGVIEIDGCRVSSDYSPSELRTSIVPTRRGTVVDFRTGDVQDLGRHNSKGRFPTNLLLKHGPDCYVEGTRRVKPSNGSGTAYQTNQVSKGSGSVYVLDPTELTGTAGYADEDGKEEVANWICEPSCPVAEMDGQSGNRISASARYGLKEGKTSFWGSSTGATHYASGYGDYDGGASRFFKQVQSEDELDDYLNTLVRGDL